MADIKLPYVTAYGNIQKALQGIQTAAEPPRFTQDFLATRLGMKGGTAKPVIPFLKRTGFLASDGAPTARYKQFRNKASSKTAAAQALRHGFQPLYEVNEYCHDLTDGELKGVIVQVTGLELEGSTTKAILGSFKALKTFASFDEPVPEDPAREAAPETSVLPHVDGPRGAGARLSLGYTINLNLPATHDPTVYAAIFRSLREHLLR